MGDDPVNIKAEDIIPPSAGLKKQAASTSKQASRDVTKVGKGSIIDGKSAVNVEDTNFSSKNFPPNLQPVEFVACEFKVKKEPGLEEAETDLTYQPVSLCGIAEDEKREIKVGRIDASSEDETEAGSMSPYAYGGHFMDADVIIKEEEGEVGVCLEEGDGSMQSDLNLSLRLENERDLRYWHKAYARNRIGENEASSQWSAASASLEAGVSAECEESCLEVVPQPQIGGNSFPCVECRSRLETKSLLKRHLASRHGKPFFCMHCSASFSKSGEYSRHAMSHAGKKIYSCVQCNASFKDRECLLQHIAGHSKSQSTEGQSGTQPSKSSVERPFRCDKCPATYKRKANLQQHMITHSGERLFTCVYCPATFKSKCDHLRHMYMHRKQFACTQCSATFRSYAHLQQHSTTHSSERPFSGDHCSATFQNKECLDDHVDSPAVKRFACTQCSATFSSERFLKQHSIAHTDIRPHACTFCPATFRNIGHLHQHLVVHSDMKPYACIHCADTFQSIGSLNQHVEIHSNEKPS